MRSLRTVVWCSALLGAAGFVGALAWLPAEDAGGGPRVSARRVPSVGEAASRVRSAMTEGRPEAAMNVASRATSFHPDEPEAWLWLVIVSHRYENEAGRAMAAGRLAVLLEGRAEPVDPGAGSRRAYQSGWARLGQGRGEEAAALFRRAAELYGEAGVRGQPRWLWLYNLACYRSLAGELDAAAGSFAEAVGAGYTDHDGWWAVDPDLDPVRGHPVFVEAAERLTRAADGAGVADESTDPRETPAVLDPGATDRAAQEEEGAGGGDDGPGPEPR